MDRKQEDIQFLGFFGIYKEAFNITTSYRKILSQITLSVILPLSLLNLAQIHISDLLSAKITENVLILDNTEIGSQKYSETSKIILSESAALLLFKIAYVIFSLTLSFISTSAVVYTIACIYTASEITFKTVMKVFPKVWKRLLITFLWKFIILFAFIMAAVAVVILWVVTLGATPSATGITFAVILSVIYLLVFLYMSFVWQLADAISVLEDLRGIQALKKSKNLIKGNTGICAAIFITNNLCFLGIDQGLKASGVGGDSVWGKLLHACLQSMLTSMLILFALVIQTIIYFICKSYHHENIDNLSLANHLDVYRENYAQLDSKDVQFEHSEV